MKRFILILSLCFVISGITFSQARFFEGFIIKNNQDTVHGLIEYKGNQTSTEVCIFKESELSDPFSYKPSDIKGYKYGMNKFYVSKEVYQNGQKRLMFVEYLVDGIVDVYCYYENNNAHYLIQTEKDSLIELKSVKKVIGSADAKAIQGRTASLKGGAETYVYESNTYKYILKEIFKASPKVATRTNSAVLDHGSLINLASTYHKEMCPDQECKIYKKQSDGHLKAGIMVGAGMVKLSKYSGTDNVYTYYLRDCEFISEISPSLGFFILAGLPGINANLYFQFEGAINKLEFSIDGHTDPNFDHHVTFSQTSLNANAVLKYAIGEKKLRPIIQFGGLSNYSVGDSYQRETTVGTSTYIYKESIFDILDLGLLVGTGFIYETVKKKVIMLDLRYGVGFNFAPCNTNYYTLGVGFQL